MRKLIRYDLDYDRTLSHFQRYLDGGKELSDAILKNHDFSKGHFFTLLTKDANLSKLYDFEIGEILPQEPVGEIYIESMGRSFQGVWVNSINEELIAFLYHKLKEDKGLACLMEDLIRSPKNSHPEVYNKIGLHYRNHVFYLVTQKKLSLSIIKESFKKSKCLGHFLAVLFQYSDLEFSNKKISGSDFQKICSNITLVIIGAYDEEGYLIWEKDGIDN